jgi:hypothetical protein
MQLESLLQIVMTAEVETSLIAREASNNDAAIKLSDTMKLSVEIPVATERDP